MPRGRKLVPDDKNETPFNLSVPKGFRAGILADLQREFGMSGTEVIHHAIEQLWTRRGEPTGDDLRSLARYGVNAVVDDFFESDLSEMFASRGDFILQTSDFAKIVHRKGARAALVSRIRNRRRTILTLRLLRTKTGLKISEPDRTALFKVFAALPREQLLSLKSESPDRNENKHSWKSASLLIYGKYVQPTKPFEEIAWTPEQSLVSPDYVAVMESRPAIKFSPSRQPVEINETVTITTEGRSDEYPVVSSDASFHHHIPFRLMGDVAGGLIGGCRDHLIGQFLGETQGGLPQPTP